MSNRSNRRGRRGYPAAGQGRQAAVGGGADLLERGGGVVEVLMELVGG